MKLISSFFALSGLVYGSATNEGKFLRAEDTVPFYADQYRTWENIMNKFLQDKLPQFPGTFQIVIQNQNLARGLDIPVFTPCTTDELDIPVSELLHKKFDAWKSDPEVDIETPYPVFSRSYNFKSPRPSTGALADQSTGYYPETLEAFAQKVIEPFSNSLRKFACSEMIHDWEPRFEILFPVDSNSSPMYSHRFWSIAGPPKEETIQELIEKYHKWNEARRQPASDPERTDALYKQTEFYTGRATNIETVESTLYSGDKVFLVKYNNGDVIVFNILENTWSEILYERREPLPAEFQIQMATVPQSTETHTSYAETFDKIHEDLLFLTFRVLVASFIVEYRRISEAQNRSHFKLLVKATVKRLAGCFVLSAILLATQSVTTSFIGRNVLAGGSSFVIGYHLGILPWQDILILPDSTTHRVDPQSTKHEEEKVINTPSIATSNEKTLNQTVVKDGKKSKEVNSVKFVDQQVEPMEEATSDRAAGPETKDKSQASKANTAASKATVIKPEAKKPEATKPKARKPKDTKPEASKAPVKVSVEVPVKESATESDKLDSVNLDDPISPIDQVPESSSSSDDCDQEKFEIL